MQRAAMAAATNATATLRWDIILVTPEMAMEWVTGKTHNRGIHQHHVRKFERLLQAGDFKLTPQGIIISTDGRLIDGQHRLLAIINTGIAVNMVVTYGWYESVQANIDQGLIRTAVDIWNIRNPDSPSTAYRMAAARRMVMGTRARQASSITNPELIAFCEQHDKALDFAISEALLGKRPRYVAPAGVAAVIARASYHEPHGRLCEFGAVMVGTRLPEGDQDSGAYLLREWLIAGMPAHGTAVRIAKDLQVYMKAQRALAAFLAHERLRALYPQQDEQWALPNEARRAAPRKPRASGSGRKTSAA